VPQRSAQKSSQRLAVRASWKVSLIKSMVVLFESILTRQDHGYDCFWYEVFSLEEIVICLGSFQSVLFLQMLFSPQPHSRHDP
jgi:hypothetical protein